MVHLEKTCNDGAAISRAYTLNLLACISRKLGADFKLDSFEHYVMYDPASEMPAYISSAKKYNRFILRAYNGYFLFRIRSHAAYLETSTPFQKATWSLMPFAISLGVG